MNFRKITAVILTLLILTTLPACGKKNNNPLLGSWTGELNMTQTMESLVNSVLGTDIEMEEVCLSATYTFTEDGIFTCRIDEASAENALEVMLDALVSCIQIEGLSQDQVRQMLVEQLDMEKQVDGLMSSFVDCFYVYREGKIYMGFDQEKLNEDPVANGVLVWSVSINNNCLAVTDIIDGEGNSIQKEMPGVLPLTLTK